MDDKFLGMLRILYGDSWVKVYKDLERRAWEKLGGNRNNISNRCLRREMERQHKKIENQLYKNYFEKRNYEMEKLFVNEGGNNA